VVSLVTEVILSRVWRTIFEDKGQDQMMFTGAILTGTHRIKQSFTPESFCVQVLRFSG
jgi:hypothetical protein